MIDHARALLRAAQEVDRRDPSPASAPDFFSSYGHAIAMPVLLSLATEIALKAWLCREGKTPIRSHDLFRLFCELEPATQKRLEEAVQPPSPYRQYALERLGIPALLEGTTGPGAVHFQGLRDILRIYGKAFEEWRYRYEDLEGTFATARFTEVLTIIIDEYFKPLRIIEEGTGLSSAPRASSVREIPKNPFHPGQMLLEEFLEPAGISQADFAGQIGWTRTRLNELIKGKRGITADAALDLSAALGTSAKLWMNLQATWDLSQALRRRQAA